MGTASGRTGLRSIFNGEPAISVRAATDERDTRVKVWEVTIYNQHL